MNIHAAALDAIVKFTYTLSSQVANELTRETCSQLGKFWPVRSAIVVGSFYLLR